VERDLQLSRQVIVDNETILKLAKQKMVETAVELINKAHESLSDIRFETPQDVRASVENYYRVIGSADVVEINEELNQLASEVKDLEGNTPLPPVDEKTGKEVLG